MGVYITRKALVSSQTDEFVEMTSGVTGVRDEADGWVNRKRKSWRTSLIDIESFQSRIAASKPPRQHPRTDPKCFEICALEKIAISFLSKCFICPRARIYFELQNFSQLPLSPASPASRASLSYFSEWKFLFSERQQVFTQSSSIKNEKQTRKLNPHQSNIYT